MFSSLLKYISIWGWSPAAPSPEKQLGPSNQLAELKSEEVESHLLKLVQSLRQGRVLRYWGILASLQLKVCGSTVFIFLLTCIRLLPNKSLQEFFFSGWHLQCCQVWTSWVSSSSKCPQGLPEGLFLQCPWDGPGQPNPSLIPFWLLRISQRRGPLGKRSCALRHTCTEPAQAPEAPRCSLTA